MLTRENDGCWLAGVFIGRPLTPILFSEEVASGRFLIRSTRDDPTSACRVGEVFGTPPTLLACRMNGDVVGRATSLLKAAEMLAPCRSMPEEAVLLVHVQYGPTFVQPSGQPGGLRIKVLRDARVRTAQLIQSLEEMVLAGGFLPHGRRTVGAPAPYGLFTVTTELWFHDRAGTGQLIRGEPKVAPIQAEAASCMQERVQLLDLPEVVKAPAGQGGLCVKLRKPNRHKLRCYAEELAKLARSHSFNPDGRATVGGPAPCGKGHESVTILFHDPI